MTNDGGGSQPHAPTPAQRLEATHGFSADGLWWFDGTTWLPTISADGLWRWNGRSWVSTRRRPTLPRWVKFCGAGWLLLLGAWLAFLTFAAGGTSDLPGWAAAPAIVLAAIAVLATLGWGAVLGKLKAWRVLAGSAPVGAAVFGFWYVVAMISSNDPTADDAAGVGLVILGVPVLVLVALLLGIGGGLAAGIRRIGDRAK